MGSREDILSTIQSALKNGSNNPQLPDPPQVWPVTGKPIEELLPEFESNLTAVSGKLVRCADRKQAAEAITARMNELNNKSFKLGIMQKDLPLALFESIEKRLGKSVTPVFAPANPDADPKNFASVDASLVAAEALLADTGTAVIRAAAAFDRFCCYLSPVCWIAAKESTLYENMPHFWPELMTRVKLDRAEPAVTGEFLFMTGPSRTADIEKILILGVHGPREVVVFSIMNE